MAFKPTMELVQIPLKEELFVEWPKLFAEVPQRIRRELDRLKLEEELEHSL